MEADDPRLVQHMFDVETDGVPSHATIAALTVEHLDRVVAERTAERDALQAQLSEMTTYRNDWQRRAQQAEQDRNDEHDRAAALQARIDAVRALANEAALGEDVVTVESLVAALGVDPQTEPPEKEHHA